MSDKVIRHWRKCRQAQKVQSRQAADCASLQVVVPTVSVPQYLGETSRAALVIAFNGHSTQRALWARDCSWIRVSAWLLSLSSCLRISLHKWVGHLWCQEEGLCRGSSSPIHAGLASHPVSYEEWESALWFQIRAISFLCSTKGAQIYNLPLLF